MNLPKMIFQDLNPNDVFGLKVLKNGWSAAHAQKIKQGGYSTNDPSYGGAHASVTIVSG